jgi:carbon-monoxide dehydrogenase large subunit
MPFGVKGAGEAGIVGPAAAIARAVEDALGAWDVEHIAATPITPPQVVRMIGSGAREEGM